MPMKISKIEKLDQRCAILAQIVTRLRRLYAGSQKTQKDLLETIIGAAIWYLPECDGLFTGEMSRKAVELCRSNRKNWAKLSKEHRYPRKRAGRDLLKSRAKLSESWIRSKYQKKWGRYNRVTKEENRKLVAFQKKNLSPKKCYGKCGIVLITKPAGIGPRTVRNPH